MEIAGDGNNIKLIRTYYVLLQQDLILVIRINHKHEDKNDLPDKRVGNFHCEKLYLEDEKVYLL